MIASRGFLSTFVADNIDRLRSKIRRCHLTPDVRETVSLRVSLCQSIALSPTYRHLQQ